MPQVNGWNTYTKLSINSGKICSKYYPNSPGYMTCTWLLTSSARVRVNLVDMYCYYHYQYLYVYDGSSTGAHCLRKYTGKYSRYSLPSPTTSSGHTMFLYWRSSYYRGFDLRYYGEPMARLSYRLCVWRRPSFDSCVARGNVCLIRGALSPNLHHLLYSFFFFLELLLSSSSSSSFFFVSSSPPPPPSASSPS